MFNWNVEDMKLLNMARDGEGYAYDKAYACESEVSIEDKFEFVDRMQEGKLSYITNLVKAYQEAIPSMKKDSEGNPTEYAKKAWVRKNDTKELFCRVTDSHGDYGDFYLLGTKVNLFTYHSRMETEERAAEERFITNLFHRQLEKCKDMEYDHFYDQNETSQFLDAFEDKYLKHKIDKLRFESDYNFSLRVKLPGNASEEGKVNVTNWDTLNDRDLTNEEIQQLDVEFNMLDGLYDQLQKAQRVYDEAREAVAERIKSMAS